MQGGAKLSSRFVPRRSALVRLACSEKTAGYAACSLAARWQRSAASGYGQPGVLRPAISSRPPGTSLVRPRPGRSVPPHHCPGGPPGSNARPGRPLTCPLYQNRRHCSLLLTRRKISRKPGSSTPGESGTGQSLRLLFVSFPGLLAYIHKKRWLSARRL